MAHTSTPAVQAAIVAACCSRSFHVTAKLAEAGAMGHRTKAAVRKVRLLLHDAYLPCLQKERCCEIHHSSWDPVALCCGQEPTGVPIAFQNRDAARPKVLVQTRRDRLQLHRAGTVASSVPVRCSCGRRTRAVDPDAACAAADPVRPANGPEMVHLGLSESDAGPSEAVSVAEQSLAVHHQTAVAQVVHVATANAVVADGSTPRADLEPSMGLEPAARAAARPCQAHVGRTLLVLRV